MITVLWEDQLGGSIKSFGPHTLLLECVADQTKFAQADLKSRIESHPLKGNGNVVRALKRDLARFHRYVFAVLDRDKAHRLLSPQTPNCLKGLRDALAADAPGEYEVVFLIDNVESLVEASCRALPRPAPTMKPTPNERDIILNAAAWGAPAVRRSILNDVPSFERLVKHVGNIVAANGVTL